MPPTGQAWGKQNTRPHLQDGRERRAAHREPPRPAAARALERGVRERGDDLAEHDEVLSW